MRLVNGLVALALAVFVLASFWPTVRLFDLSRADLMIQGEWLAGPAKRLTAVTPGGPADRAGLRPGDVLEFDPERNADWILAGYRDVPEGFQASLPVRRADGTKTTVTLVPERVVYLPTFNDRAALVTYLIGTSVLVLLGVFLVWAHPGLMTWCLLLGFVACGPRIPWAIYYLAFAAGPGFDAMAVVTAVMVGCVVAFIPFALCFPRNTLVAWAWWKRVLGVLLLLVTLAFISFDGYAAPFVRDAFFRDDPRILTVTTYVACVLVAIFILVHTYRRADGPERARLKWALLGLSAALAGAGLSIAFGILPVAVSGDASGSALTPTWWALAVCYGILFPVALGIAVLKERVVDVQFAVSRTLVFGAVTTLVLVFLAAVHWILGKMIEQTHLAIGLEALAAIGLGLVLHRATEAITGLVERLLFRRRHEADLRLRRVTSTLSFATEARSIAEALVLHTARDLDLASAALFGREAGERPFQRALAHGWSDENATALDPESLLVRCLQADHEPLKLDDESLVPPGTPQDAALPVLAIPIVTQHSLIGVVLYGMHTNFTLPDPHEVQLLRDLAKAAAATYQQLRIAELAQQVEARQTRIVELETSLRALGHEGLAGEHAAAGTRFGQPR